MKYLIQILLVVFSFTTASAQVFWVKPKKIQNDTWCLTDTSTGETYFCDSISAYHNYNPVLSLSENQIDFAIEQDKMLNVYTVYHTSKNSNEQYIWGLSSQKEEIEIMTNYRYANLLSGDFMNFIDHAPGELYLSNFVDQKPTGAESLLKLGGKAQRSDVPVQKSTADIAELVIFDQALSPIGKNMLETSLALKYSITLAPLTDYRLDPAGKTLWDATLNADYHNNIAGIARRDHFHLYQKQSKSSIEDGFLAIAIDDFFNTNDAHTSILNEDQSMVWGDNQGALQFQLGNEGLEYLERTWKLENHGFTNESFELHLSSLSINTQVPENHSLWMKIRSANEYQLFPASKEMFQKVSFFDGSQTLKFFHAPPFWIDVNITPAQCQDNQLASIDLQVMGVEAPFTLLVEDTHTGNVIFKEVLDHDDLQLTDLAAGQYKLTVHKDENVLIQQDINVADTGVPALQIANNYIFTEKENRTIDASYGIPSDWDYEWTLPNQETVYGSVLEFNESGLYWVKISNGSCVSWFSIDVTIVKENIRSVLVYPNPSPDGFFKLNVELENPYETKVTITNVLGNQLISRIYPGQYVLQDEFRLFHDGVYFITIQSASSIHTEKLIVQYPN